MIDVHSHILPGVDDGSASMKESLQMLSIALYVLYNNYIYNVYKDGKYRLEGGA